jgi:hypothetical protein
MGLANNIRVIILKYKKNPYSTHCGNREWVTLTECCSLTGQYLGSWTIFKEKVVAVTALLGMPAKHQRGPERTRRF